MSVTDTGILTLGGKIEKGYSKARAKIDNRIHLVIAQLYNKYKFEEFTYSSIELSKKCGTRDYACRKKGWYLLQTYRGNSISKKMSTYRIREENFTPELMQLAKSLFDTKPIELREPPKTYDEMRYITFNLTNVSNVSNSDILFKDHKFKIKQLERAIKEYGVKEDPDNEHLVTLAIPHKQIGCRLYSIWPFCLQCAPSDLRQFTIYGDSIDLDAASVQCMVELGKQHGGKEEDIQILSDYITHKSELRKQIAEEFGVDEDVIKCIFNIMVLGGHGSVAQVTTNFRDTNSIARVVGDSAKAGAIVSSEFVKPFYLAVKTLRKLIVNAMYEDTDNGWSVTNSLGKKKYWVKKAEAKRHVKPVARMMSWIYTGWELSTMQENTSGRGLPVHDSREGLASIDDICTTLDFNNIMYSVKTNTNHNTTINN